MFAGRPDGELSPASRRLHGRCGLGSGAVDVRRAEDRVALELLGARVSHGDLLDAVYRRRNDGAWLCTSELDVFARQPVDRALTRSVLHLVLEAVDQARPGLLLAPDGIGGHTDDCTVRHASLRVAHQRGLPLLLWEDQPYALQHRPRRSPGALHVSYTPRTLEAKLDAVACYASQLPILWLDGGDWRALLGASSRTARAPAGEWFRRASSASTRSA